MRYKLTPPKPKISENDVEAQIRLYLARRGWTLERNHVGTFKRRGAWITIGEKGKPDWLATKPVRPGIAQLVWIEVKRPGEEPSEDQINWMRKARALGYAAEWFDSVTSLAEWFESQLPV